MRVSIVSRVFSPEPAAAAFRLEALAHELDQRGHVVDVVTSSAPRARRSGSVSERTRVHRAPVLRDKSGVVRGYVPYLSFDVPAFFRLLFHPAPDVYLVEPPPTTGIIVRIVATLRRRPYVYFAGDVLADAARGAGTFRPIVAIVRRLELWSWHAASHVLAVSEGVRTRLVELGVRADRISVVGNGVDARIFRPDGRRIEQSAPYMLYAGTASEVHGAGVFVEAMTDVPDATLIFLGGGAEIEQLKDRANHVAPGRVIFLPSVPADVAAQWFRGAAVSLGSVKPGANYDFAFPTKLYAASACGSPIIFCGTGPGSEYAAAAPLGATAVADPRALSKVMREMLARRVTDADRFAQAQWAHDRASLQSAARKGADVIEAAAERR